MKQYTAEEIQQRFETLPQEIKDAIASTDVHDSLKAISTKYGLHIDQQGELVDLVGLVMLGLSPAKDFVSDFSQVTGVNTAVAQKIATEINAQVLDKIRSSMRAFEEKAGEETPPSPIGASNHNFSNASLERAGNFSIEPEMPVAPSMPQKKINLLEPDATEADHAETLHSIENPTLNRQQAAAKSDAEHYEPLVDQLLKGPAAIPLEKITVKPPANLPTGDPYREPIK